MSSEPVSENRRRLAAQVKANVRQEFGRCPFTLLSEKVIEAIVDAHVLRVVATWETDITAEKIAVLRTDSRAAVMFDL